MITAIIIDDETSALKSLEWELSNFGNSIEVLGCFTNPKLAVTFLNQNAVDCVFLDIEMPDMDGFQFLDLFSNRNFSVVITTAYDQYAIKAIKERALDYLLKPVDSDDLKVCLDKIKLFKEEHSIQDRLEQTLENLVLKNKNQLQKISVSCDGKIIFLNPEDIVYCESDGNYCTIHLENKDTILLSQKLKFMEEKLTDFYFFRIHNSYLINLNKVKEFHKSDEYVVLSNNIKLPVSRAKKSNFLDKL